MNQKDSRDMKVLRGTNVNESSLSSAHLTHPAQLTQGKQTHLAHPAQLTQGKQTHLAHPTQPAQGKQVEPVQLAKLANANSMAVNTCKNTLALIMLTTLAMLTLFTTTCASNNMC